MNRTTPALAVTALLLATSAIACGSQNGDDDKPAAAPAASSTLSKGDRFLNAVHAKTFDSWADAAPTDDELLDYPQAWCNALDEGHSVTYLFDLDGADLYPLGADWGTKKPEANELLVMGVKAYCPKLSSQVTDQLRESGEY